MKRLLIAVVAIFLLASCAAYHTGSVSTSNFDKDVVYKDIAIGKARSTRYFGFGGNTKEALVFEARKNMIRNRPLQKGEQYANTTLSKKVTFFSFHTTTEITVASDVIQHSRGSENAIYSNVYKKKVFYTNSNPLFAAGDTVVINSKILKAEIIAIVNTKRALLKYYTSDGEEKIKEKSLNSIFTTNRGYNGIKPGAKYYYLNAGDKKIDITIIGVGLESVFVKNEYGNFMSFDYEDLILD